MNAISMALLLDALAALDACAQIPRTDDDFTRRLSVSTSAHTAAFRLRAALAQLPAVAIIDNRDEVTA